MPRKSKQEKLVTEDDLIENLEELVQEFDRLIKKENIMAKAKPQVKTLSDKLAKVNESFTINMYDNGFMIEVGGRDADEEWKTAKVMVSTVEELLTLVKEATEMDRDN